MSNRGIKTNNRESTITCSEERHDTSDGWCINSNNWYCKRHKLKNPKQDKGDS